MPCIFNEHCTEGKSSTFMNQFNNNKLPCIIKFRTRNACYASEKVKKLPNFENMLLY